MPELEERLGYEDLRATHEWRRWTKIRKSMQAAEAQGRPYTHFWVQENGVEALNAKIADLAATRFQSALFRDDRGLWTWSGLAGELAEAYGEKVHRAFRLPEPGLLGFRQKGWDPRWYQLKAVEALIERIHAGVEIATGLGKSYLAALLIQALGLSTLVLAPTLSIANQLLADFQHLFGSAKVGQFFAGKKQPERSVVVAVSASLLRVKPGSAEEVALQQKAVLIGDESHMLPAETLSRVVLGMLGQIPYRFFLSGTQLRTDGLDLLLRGIVGDIVLRMDVQQGVDGGFLSPLRFFQFLTDSEANFSSDDVIRLNRVHLHDNPKVYAHAGANINHALAKGRRPLVLIEELDQFTKLLPHLRARAALAHGGVTKDNKALIPEEYHKSDPGKLVKAFDSGDLPILVGTSCIGMGTDIKSASFVVDLVGGGSEIRLRQAVGRGTRLSPGKEDCIYCDYAITNQPKLVKQAEFRKSVFEAIYGRCRRVEVK